MSQGGNVAEYVNSFVEITDKLAELDINIKDELKVIMMLTSLPNNFENFVVAIETRDKLPSFENVKLKLLEEGARREERDERDRTNETVYSHVHAKNHEDQRKIDRRDKIQKNRKKNTDKGDDRDHARIPFEGKCYNCKKYGHRASECRSKRKNERDKEQQSNNCLMHSQSGVVSQKFDTWCVDSGATSHMCCVKSMFKTLKSKKSIIMLADKKYIESPGTGTVTFKIMV